MWGQEENPDRLEAVGTAWLPAESLSTTKVRVAPGDW